MELNEREKASHFLNGIRNIWAKRDYLFIL